MCGNVALKNSYSQAQGMSKKFFELMGIFCNLRQKTNVTHK